MKVFIYFILIIAFLMFYQQNPIFAIIFVLLFLGVYLFFKSRKQGNRYNRGKFFSGKYQQQNDRMDDLLTLFLLQQVFEPTSKNDENYFTAIKDRTNESQNHIDKTKKEVLELLKLQND